MPLKHFWQLSEPERYTLYLAWLNGSTIQWADSNGVWYDDEPEWYNWNIYRIKP